MPADGIYTMEWHVNVDDAATWNVSCAGGPVCTIFLWPSFRVLEITTRARRASTSRRRWRVRLHVDGAQRGDGARRAIFSVHVRRAWR